MLVADEAHRQDTGDLRCRDADEQSAALRVKPASGETPWR
jgi:hypothetical protein